MPLTWVPPLTIFRVAICFPLLLRYTSAIPAASVERSQIQSDALNSLGAGMSRYFLLLFESLTTMELRNSHDSSYFAVS